MNILLFGSSERGALEVCRSLGRAGHRVSVLRLSAHRIPADYSKFCAESLYINSLDIGARRYTAKLMEVLRQGHYDYLIPIDDLSSELVYSSYDAISSATRVVGPSPSSYFTIRNRFHVAAIAETAGLPSLGSTLLRIGTTTLPNVPLPCFVKPVFSSAILDDEPQCFSVRKVNNRDELEAKLRDDLARVDVLVQTPAEGLSLEVVFGAFLGEVIAVSAMSHLHGCRGVRGSSYVVTTEIPPRLLTIVRRIAKEVSWTGLMALKCIQQEGRFRLIDLEPSAWSAVALPILAGVDFPNLLVNAFEGKRHPEVAPAGMGIHMRNVRMDAAWLLSKLALGTSPKLIARWIGSLSRVLVGREYWEIERIKDPLPTIGQFDRHFRSLGRKVARHLLNTFRRLAGANGSVPRLSKDSSLLVVCKGNINRSVVAEQLFNAKGFSVVRSAGLLPMSGRRPSKPAELFLEQRLGIDTSTLRSQSITRALSRKIRFDYVLCFERAQVIELTERFPSLRGKTFVISQFAGDGAKPRDISDPHGASAAAYLACFETIEKLVGKIAAADAARSSWATPDLVSGVARYGECVDR